MPYLEENPVALARSMIEGIQSTYPGLYVNTSRGLTLLNRERSDRVALLGCGGAGLEPFGQGYVGENMLTGYVNGPVFDSPPVGNIVPVLQYLSHVNAGGVLLFLMNSPSIKLTFSFAMENARKHGCKLEAVHVNDDCSLVGANGVLEESISDRRTLSGAVLSFKILGGMATRGARMEELLWEERLVKCRTASASVIYSPPTIPGNIRPQYNLSRDTVSLGVGVMAEEGGKYTFQMQRLEETVASLVKRLLPRVLLYEEGSVAVLVNSLGSLTNFEAYAVARHLHHQLGSRRVDVERMYVGRAMSSLDGRGFVVSLLNVTDKTGWVELLDLETEAWAWPGSRLSRRDRWSSGGRSLVKEYQHITEMSGGELDWEEGNMFRETIASACTALSSSRAELDRLSEGFCQFGTDAHHFAQGVLREVKKSSSLTKSVANTFLKLSQLAEVSLGPSFGLLFLGASLGAPRGWSEVWAGAVTTLSKYSALYPGKGSLMDTIVPACKMFQRIVAKEGQGAWKSALKAATEVAEDTCKKHINPGDPLWKGRAAMKAVAITLRAAYDQVSK